jgi:6,7-dimethyl-8-ribityllumazine synthase
MTSYDDDRWPADDLDEVPAASALVQAEEEPEAAAALPGLAVEDDALPDDDAADDADDDAAPLLDVPPPVVQEHAAGDFHVPDGYATLQGDADGRRRSVAVVVARFNAEITTKLLERALEELDAAGVARDAVTVMPVPGAFELPLAAMALAKTRRYACVVALGAVIRGETAHFDFVAAEAASGLQLAALETGVPVSFGVLTTDTAEQAEARVERAADAVRSGLEMADLFHKLRVHAAAGR